MTNEEKLDPGTLRWVARGCLAAARAHRGRAASTARGSDRLILRASVETLEGLAAELARVAAEVERNVATPALLVTPAGEKLA